MGVGLHKEGAPKEEGKEASRRPEKFRFARPEAVLIKPVEGMSYATILRELKKRVNPNELGATVQGIRKTRSKDLLAELKCSTKSRERLGTAFKQVVGARGTVCHLIPRIEVEIADLEPAIEAEDVEDPVRSYLDQGPELELRVSLSKTPIKKKEVNRFFHCLGFGQMAADCRGPDRNRCCWRCG